MTIQAFIVQNRIKFTAEEIGSRADGSEGWIGGSRHWRCKFRCGRKSMTVEYSQGPAIERDPTASDVLDCIASDVGGIKSARSFEEWASDLGYDTDSRKAEQTFKAIERQAARLESMLGVEATERLCFETERL
jgi:hypothetical protein